MKAIRVENVIFFTGKRDFLICYRGRFTKVVNTKDGIMVELSDFPNYFYCPRSGEVFSGKSGKYQRVKKHLSGPSSYFYLFVNGVSKRVYHEQIMAKDGKKIQKCAEEKNLPKYDRN